MRQRLGPGALWISTILLGCASWCSVPAAVAKGVEPRVEALDNGFKILMVERHEQPMIAAGMFYDVGSVNDPEGKSGLAHLFEHMLFKGSKVIGTNDYAAEMPIMDQLEKLRDRMNDEMNRMRLMKRRGQIDDVLDPKQWTPEYTAMKKQEDELVATQRALIKNNELSNLYTTNGGAGLNAGTSEDVTFYFVQLPSNKLELFFWLESDRMVNGIMREFYVERDNVREERRLRTDSTPTGKLDEAFEALFWQSHAYGVPVLGWASEVESITVDDVRQFYKLHYAPNNVVLVLVGDFASDTALALAKRYFGRIPRNPTEPPPVITEEPRPIAERRLNGEADANPQVAIRFHGVAMGHKDEPALDVLSEILSGKTGRLYKRLIVADDVAIGQPRAGNEARKYAGSFEINATVKKGREPELVERTILEELDKLRDGPISDRELQKVKNQVLASSVRRLQSNFGLMLQLGLFETFLDWKYINEAPERMLAVTADDVRRVVKTYIDPKHRTVAIYRTKAAPPAGSAAGEDPDLVALLKEVPEDQHGRVKAMIAQVTQLSDLDKLKQMRMGIEMGMSSGQLPPDRKATFEYLIKTINKRLKELEGAGKESK